MSQLKVLVIGEKDCVLAEQWVDVCTTTEVDAAVVAREFAPHVVIMDASLGELIRDIRSENEQDAAFIAVGEAQDRHQCWDRFHYFYTRPIDKKHLLTTLLNIKRSNDLKDFQHGVRVEDLSRRVQRRLRAAC